MKKVEKEKRRKKGEKVPLTVRQNRNGNLREKGIHKRRANSEDHPPAASLNRERVSNPEEPRSR